MTCNRCLFCSNILDKDHGRVVDATFLEIIEILFENSEVEAEIGSGMCYACEEKLKVAFKFKGQCIYTEDRLHPFVSGTVENNEKIDLKTVYAKEKQCKEPNDGYVCRLCLELVDEHDKHLFLEVLENENVKDTLEMYLPEVKLDSSEDPIICEPCLQSLINFLDFITSSRPINIDTKVEPAGNLRDMYIKLEPLDIVSVKEEKDSELPERKAVMKKYEKNSGSGLYRCQLCSKEYKAIWHMEKHMRSHLGIWFECKICSYKSRYESCLDKHMINHKKGLKIYKRNKCEYRSKYKSMDRSHKILKCTLCSFQNINKKSMRNHVLRHSSGKIYKCVICPHETTDPACLKMHERLKHSDAIKIKTKHRNSMDVQMKRHKYVSRIDTYQCAKCSYMTTTKCNLMSHMVVHKKKMYKCPYCSVEIKHRQSLSKHIKLSHGSIIKILKCELCTFSTKYSHSMDRHIKRHKDISEVVDTYQCAKCCFKTIDKYLLIKHVLVHKSTSEVEMYKCPDCSLQYNYKQNLLRHTKLFHKDGYAHETSQKS